MISPLHSLSGLSSVRILPFLSQAQFLSNGTTGRRCADAECTLLWTSELSFRTFIIGRVFISIGKCPVGSLLGRKDG